MKRLLLLSASISVLYFNSCDEGPTSPQDNVLWPMAVGNQWIGLKEYRDAGGNVVGRERDTLRITGAVGIDGETWYEFSDGALRRNRPDGVWSRIPGSTEKKYTHIFAKYPSAAGDTFSTDNFVQTFENGQQGQALKAWIETITIDSVVTVPYGRLRAHVYESVLEFPQLGGDANALDRWSLTPGVGPVTMKCGGAVSCVWKLEKALVK